MSEISSLALIDFNGLEESLEVSGSKSLVISSLDDLNKECRSILNWLGENLKKVSFVVVVYKDVELLDSVEVFLNFSWTLS